MAARTIVTPDKLNEMPLLLTNKRQVSFGLQNGADCFMSEANEENQSPNQVNPLRRELEGKQFNRSNLTLDQTRIRF